MRLPRKLLKTMRYARPTGVSGRDATLDTFKPFQGVIQSLDTETALATGLEDRNVKTIFTHTRLQVGDQVILPGSNTQRTVGTVNEAEGIGFGPVVYEVTVGG